MESFYRAALDRLAPGERLRERSRDIPYPLSLHALARFFFETGGRQGWLPVRGTILAAVSGGGDSLALLWLFRVLYGGPVLAVHVNHGIRGAESDADASFVRRMAAAWDVGFREVRINVPRGRVRGESLEAAARRMRYEGLTRAAEDCGAVGIALGHNRDDVAETVLFNLIRGTGVRGCVGMPERRGLFFRPLLSLRRGFLRDILRCRGIPWREDSSNEDLRHTRNFLRRSLLPLAVERVNAGAVEHLAAFAEEMRGYREEEERRGAELAESVGLRRFALPVEMGREALAGLSVRDRALLIRELARRLKLPVLSRARCLELARLLDGRKGFRFFWGGGVTVRGGSSLVSWERQPDGADPF